MMPYFNDAYMRRSVSISDKFVGSTVQIGGEATTVARKQAASV